MADTPDPGTKKPRGRPPKYATAQARQAARRAQVREATRIWRENRRASERVSHRSLEDAGRIIDRVINNMLTLAARVDAQAARYPAGFSEWLQVYAADARDAAAHLRYVLDAAHAGRARDTGD